MGYVNSTKIIFRLAFLAVLTDVRIKVNFDLMVGRETNIRLNGIPSKVRFC